MRGDGQLAALGGVGFGAVGVQPGQVVRHHLHQVLVGLGGGHPGEQGVDRGVVDTLGVGGGPVARGDDGGEDLDLLAGHGPGGAAGGHRGQRLEGAPGADQPGRGPRGEPAVPAQPRGHALQPVGFGGLGEFAAAHGAGQLGVEHVPRRDQRGGALQQFRAGQGVQVGVGEGTQRIQQPAHVTPPQRPEHLYEV